MPPAASRTGHARRPGLDPRRPGAPGAAAPLDGEERACGGPRRHSAGQEEGRPPPGWRESPQGAIGTTSDGERTGRAAEWFEGNGAEREGSAVRFRENLEVFRSGRYRIDGRRRKRRYSEEAAERAVVLVRGGRDDLMEDREGQEDRQKCCGPAGPGAAASDWPCPARGHCPVHPQKEVRRRRGVV